MEENTMGDDKCFIRKFGFLDIKELTTKQKERARVICALNEGKYSELSPCDLHRYRGIIKFYQLRANGFLPRAHHANKNNKWIVTDDTARETAIQLALYPDACVTSALKRLPGYEGQETLIIQDDGSKIKMKALEPVLRGLGDNGINWSTKYHKDKPRPKRVIVISKFYPIDIGFRHEGMEWRFNLAD